MTFIILIFLTILIDMKFIMAVRRRQRKITLYRTKTTA